MQHRDLITGSVSQGTGLQAEKELKSCVAAVTADMFGADKRELFMRKTASRSVKFGGGSAVVLSCLGIGVACSHLLNCELQLILKNA